MTPEEIRSAIENLDEAEEQIGEIRVRIQDLCEHPDASKEYKANSGNYDPSADSYWIEYKCPDCGRFWMEDQ